MEKKAYKIPSVKIIVLRGEGLLAGSTLSSGGDDDGTGGTGDAKSFSDFYDLDE